MINSPLIGKSIENAKQSEENRQQLKRIVNEIYMEKVIKVWRKICTSFHLLLMRNVTDTFPRDDDTVRSNARK